MCDASDGERRKKKARRENKIKKQKKKSKVKEYKDKRKRIRKCITAAGEEQSKKR